MGFSVVFGEDVDEDFLEGIKPVDYACYDRKYWGQLPAAQARYRKNPRSYVFVTDDDSASDGGSGPASVAGYINFFPCEEGLYLDNVLRSPVIRDDDIRPEEVAPWRHEANHVYVYSLAIHPDYQNTDAIKVLTRGFRDCLRRLEGEGFPISDIDGTTISPHGSKAARRWGFRKNRDLADGTQSYLLDGSALRAFLEGD